MSNPKELSQQTAQQILPQRGYQNPLFLGQGRFGTVYRVEKDTKFFAAKVVLTDRVSPGELRAGTFLLQKGLKSQYLVNLREYIQIPPYSIFVMDYANLLDLSESHTRTPHMPPSTVLMIAYQILGGLSVMHESGLIHRNLQPENILFHYDHDLDKVFVKISGFGKATDFQSRNDEPLSDYQHFDFTGQFSGTPIYIAPEIMLYGGDYENKVDCWAVGIMIYKFLYGKHPFNISNYPSMARSIEQGVQFPENPFHPNNPEWALVNPLNNIIQGLLQPSPQNRLSARDALSLECFRNLWDLPNPSLTWAQYTTLMKNPYLPKPARPTLPNVVAPVAPPPPAPSRQRTPSPPAPSQQRTPSPEPSASRWKNRVRRSSEDIRGDSPPGAKVERKQGSEISVPENYTFIRTINSGGFGTVVEMEDKQTKERVAGKMIQCLTDKQSERIAREVGRLKRFAHAGIVSLKKMEEMENMRVIVMELGEKSVGDLVNEYKERGSAIPREIVYRIMVEISSALCFMHNHKKKRTSHGDVKMENILLFAHNHAKLCDLGAAESEDVTTSRTVMSLQYVSPERLADETGRATPESDVWSLGIVLHWLLFGEPLFKSQNTMKLLQEIGSFKATDIGKSCGEDERNLLMRILDPNPVTRLTSKQLSQSTLFRCVMNTKDAIWRLFDQNEKEFMEERRRLIGTSDNKS
ncbi:putative Ribosomal protein S6 kinase alpha-5 [Blattamonas nauphoetae]|uniref:Ribosomal protein S6 kinase alpha-5 n=1 Tax=Blattamonas nauphoetae TaxID=2049346 RepID=A0ABQ9XRE9_9EUKA|nr:putative Ribosomal protein S6 kinase alpha-5 [Blattamonas nauphoetae]